MWHVKAVKAPWQSAALEAAAPLVAKDAMTLNNWQRAKHGGSGQNRTMVAKHMRRDGRRGRLAVITAAQFLAITPVATWTSAMVSVAICMLVETAT